MMDETQEKRGRKPRVWLRLTAIVSAVLLVCSAVLLDAVTVTLSRQELKGTDVTAAAGNYLADSTPYIKQDVVRRAQKVLTGALRKPVTLQDYYDLASEAIARKNYEGALALIDVCLGLADIPGANVANGLHVDLLMKKGCLLALRGDYYQALALFDQALKLDSSQAQAYLLEAQIYAQQNSVANATENLRAYLKLEPGDTSMRAALIQLYYAQGKYADAEIACNDYLALLSDADGSIHFLRGACRLQQAGYQPAMDDLLQAVQLGYPDAGLCYGQAALCAYALNKPELVLDYGRQSVALDSKQMDYGKLYSYMGLSSLLLKKFQDAEAQFTSALDHGQSEAATRYYRGVSRMAQGQAGSAVEDFSAAIAAGENTAQCYYNRGACYLKLNDRKKALEDMKSVVSLNTDADLTALAKSIVSQLEKG